MFDHSFALDLEQFAAAQGKKGKKKQSTAAVVVEPQVSDNKIACTKRSFCVCVCVCNAIIYMVRPPTMIHLELFYMVKHGKNTHFSKTKFVFDFHFCFERKCIFPWVFEGFSKKTFKNLGFLRFLHIFLGKILF